MPIVAEQVTAAAVNEQQFVPVRVTGEVIHGSRHLPDAELHLVIEQQATGIPRRGAKLLEMGCIEGTGLELAFKTLPAGRCMAVVHMTDRTKKPFAPQF